MAGTEAAPGGDLAALGANACNALQAWLYAHLPGAGQLKSIEKFIGGQSNPTHLVTTSGGQFVLRRKPPGTLLPSAHAVDREYRVLKALGGTGVPVPAVHGYCDDPGVIGSAFYLMQYMAGHIYWNPELPQLSSARRAALYDEMNRVLAMLHEVDPGAIGLADYGRASGYYPRQVRRWSEQYRAAETEQRDDMERLISWLPAHLPAEDGQVALVHGDFRLDNLIFNDADRVVAILDWELSTLGHPYADLAYQCAQWRLPAGALRGLAGIDRLSLGIPAEDAYMRDYLARRRRPAIEGWHFFLALSLFRLASICQGVYRRSIDGNASSADAGGFGDKVTVIAATAMTIVDDAETSKLN